MEQKVNKVTGSKILRKNTFTKFMRTRSMRLNPKVESSENNDNKKCLVNKNMSKKILSETKKPEIVNIESCNYSRSKIDRLLSKNDYSDTITENSKPLRSESSNDLLETKSQLLFKDSFKILL